MEMNLVYLSSAQTAMQMVLTTERHSLGAADGDVEGEALGLLIGYQMV